jgi:recombination protein RecA
MAKEDKKVQGFAPPKSKDTKSIISAINNYSKANLASLAGEDERVSSDNPFKYSTGILSLDKYLGVGGVLGGRIMNAWGWEGSGKTLTALSVIASFQAQGKKCAFLDAEGTLSNSMATAVGVNVDDLIVVQSTPERILTGEDYFSLIQMLIQSEVELIVIDSTPALIPSQRMAATIGQGQKASHASMMSEGLQQVTALLNAHRRSVIWFINQVRAKPMQMFGPSEDHTGGNALKFYATYSLDVDKMDDIVKKVPQPNGRYEEANIGVTVRAKLKKNKTAIIPIGSIEFDIYFKSCTDVNGVTYQAGVDIYKDMVECGIANGVINQSSSWFSYGDIKANGKDALIMALRKADRSIIEEIRSKVLHGDGKPLPVPEAPAE